MAQKSDYTPDYAQLDLRARPELYRVGVGERGVLLVHWRFATPQLAQQSSQALYAMFLAYLKAGDFVGVDTARKFLQMGYARAWRYANHKGGKKLRWPCSRVAEGQERGTWQAGTAAHRGRSAQGRGRRNL